MFTFSKRKGAISTPKSFNRYGTVWCVFFRSRRKYFLFTWRNIFLEQKKTHRTVLSGVEIGPSIGTERVKSYLVYSQVKWEEQPIIFSSILNHFYNTEWIDSKQGPHCRKYICHWRQALQFLEWMSNLILSIQTKTNTLFKEQHRNLDYT